MEKVTLHIISTPHVQTTNEFNQCAYQQKSRRFCGMMKKQGYKTILYASEENEADCDELVTCITKAQQGFFFEEYDWWKKKQIYSIPYDPGLPYWSLFNKNVIKEMKKRIAPGDLICVLAGHTQREIGEAFPSNKTVEYGIGYTGIHHQYKVFESYAWMHYLYGLHRVSDYMRHWDTVIPNYFDVSEFPYKRKKEDYLLFMARPIPAKGLASVIILGSMGHKIKVAGAQKIEGKNIEWVGYADAKMRGELMSNAKALLSPTLYVGPFEGVVAEAALCGTPAITTNWGCFHETVEQGRTGFRCYTVQEMDEAIKKAHTLNPKYIRDRAVGLWSTDAVGPQYDTYFKRIAEMV